jgi:hypothetical protein
MKFRVAADSQKFDLGEWAGPEPGLAMRGKPLLG